MFAAHVALAPNTLEAVILIEEICARRLGLLPVGTVMTPSRQHRVNHFSIGFTGAERMGPDSGQDLGVSSRLVHNGTDRFGSFTLRGSGAAV